MHLRRGASGRPLSPRGLDSDPTPAHPAKAGTPLNFLTRRREGISIVQKSGLREVEAAASATAERKAERRVQYENARTESERIGSELRAAHDASESLQIAAGGATHRYGEREAQLNVLETQLLEARGRTG